MFNDVDTNGASRYSQEAVLKTKKSSNKRFQQPQVVDYQPFRVTNNLLKMYYAKHFQFLLLVFNEYEAAHAR